MLRTRNVSCLKAGLLAAAITFGGLVAGTQNAVAFGFTLLQQHGFVGLWEAVDREDGSALQMSIVKTGDSTFEVLLRDSFFSGCIDTGFTSGRGISSGTGTILSKNSLEFDFTRYCFSDADPTSPVENQVGTVQISLNPKGRLLVLEFDPGIYFHRVSE